MEKNEKKWLEVSAISKVYHPNWTHREMCDFLIKHKFIVSADVGIGNSLSEEGIRYIGFQLDGDAYSNGLEIREDVAQQIWDLFQEEQDKFEYEENLRIEYNACTKDYNDNIDRIALLQDSITADYKKKLAKFILAGLKK
jgi:hypothetical protein